MPVVVSTFAFMRVVVMVSVPALSVTQNEGATQVALTESDVVVGSVAALVYSTRKMSSWQTWIRSTPVLSVKVTPLASMAYDVPCGGAGQTKGAPPLPPAPAAAVMPPLPPLAPDIPAELAPAVPALPPVAGEPAWLDPALVPAVPAAAPPIEPADGEPEPELAQAAPRLRVASKVADLPANMFRSVGRLRCV
jgi:hypothetical protein